MGNVVAARISLENEERLEVLVKRIRRHCKDKLDSYKIPAYIEITKERQFSARFKKIRK